MSDLTKMPDSHMNRLCCQPDERSHGTADDGTTLEFMLQTTHGNSYICKMPPFFVSNAAILLTCEEIWYFLEGHGQFWLNYQGKEYFFKFQPGTSIHVPKNTPLQFRNDSDKTAIAHVVTMPPWPGAEGLELTTGPFSE